jgi:hypothetical protein
MKTEKKYFTVGTIPISNIKIAKRGKIDSDRKCHIFAKLK